jgi:hypothetical protein
MAVSVVRESQIIIINFDMFYYKLAIMAVFLLILIELTPLMPSAISFTGRVSREQIDRLNVAKQTQREDKEAKNYYQEEDVPEAGAGKSI